MSEIRIVIKRGEDVLAEKASESEVYLVYNGIFENGDEIVLSFPEDGFYTINLDDGIGRAELYAKKGDFTFPIPFGKAKDPYNPNAFLGDRHLLYAGFCPFFDKNTKRNVAFNPYDIHSNKTIFPHSYANVETRGEAVFFSRNAIDGVLASSGHGKWPYSSWGINRDPEAKLYLDFGRVIIAEEIALYLRSDFPHDSYWTEVKVKLTGPDGEKTWVFNTVKKDGRQSFKIEPFKAERLELGSLIKSQEDPSPFPALTQIEVIGRD